MTRWQYQQRSKCHFRCQILGFHYGRIEIVASPGSHHMFISDRCFRTVYWFHPPGPNIPLDFLTPEDRATGCNVMLVKNEHMAQHNPQQQRSHCHFRCLPVKNWEEKMPIWHFQCHCFATLLQICHYKGEGGGGGGGREREEELKLQLKDQYWTKPRSLCIKKTQNLY